MTSYRHPAGSSDRDLPWAASERFPWWTLAAVLLVLATGWAGAVETVNLLTTVSPVPVAGIVTQAPEKIDYTEGDVVKLEAVPARYFRFDHWEDGSTNNPRNVVLTTNTFIVAQFTNTVALEERVIREEQLVFGGSKSDELRALLALGDGGLVLGGASSSGTNGNKASPGQGNADFWALRTDAGGTAIWEADLGGSASDYLYALQRSPDGSYLLGGYSGSVAGTNLMSKTSTNYGAADFWVVKLDAQGRKLWEQTCGGTGNDFLRGLALTPDGGCLLGGYSGSADDGNKTGTNYGGYDFWIVKLDRAGAKQWEQTFGGAGDDELRVVQPTGDGGFLLAGDSDSGKSGNKSSPNHGGHDYWVIKIDAGGQMQWEQTYGGDGDEFLSAVLPTSDGGFLLGGFSSSDASTNKAAVNFGGFDYWIVKVDASGKLEWDRSFGGDGLDYLTALQHTADGGYLLGGYSYSGATGSKQSDNLGEADFWVVRTDGAGNRLSEQSLGGATNDFLFAIAPAIEGGYVFGGYSASGTSGTKTVAGFGATDYWVVRQWTRAAPIGAPFVAVGGQTNSAYNFTNATTVEVQLSTTFTNGTTYYTVDGSVPSFASTPYTGPFTVSNSVTLRAVAYTTNLVAVEADPVAINLWTTFTLTATNHGGGTVTLDPPGGVYRNDATVVVAATPDAGWQFLQWRSDATGTNPLITVTTDKIKLVEAVFGTTLTVQTNGVGTVQRNPDLVAYPFGSVIQLTAVPGPGHAFVLWGGAASGNANPYAYYVGAPGPVISAQFVSTNGGEVTLKLLIVGHGVVTNDPPANTYTNGQTVTLTAVSDIDNYFLEWTGDVLSELNPLTIILDNDKLITATFASRGDPVDLVLTGQPANGVFRLTLTGPIGRRCWLQSAPQLPDWKTVGHLDLTNGVGQWDDPAGVGGPARYYRAFLP